MDEISSKARDYQLYFVTDSQTADDDLALLIQRSVQGGVTMVQVREKQADDTSFLMRANIAKQALQGSSVPLIINDHVELALEINADGVHLGQSDMPVQQARHLLGPDKIIGLTVENEQQLFAAQQLPIDYIGISTVFASSTKLDTKHVWGLDGLQQAVQISQIPLVAIGGIDMNNIALVAETQVAGIALVSAISQADDPYLAAQQLKQLCK